MRTRMMIYVVVQNRDEELVMEYDEDEEEEAEIDDPEPVRSR